jgi:hypothetical protein
MAHVDGQPSSEPLADGDISGLPVSAHAEYVDWNAGDRARLVNSNFQGHCRDSVAAFSRTITTERPACPIRAPSIHLSARTVHVSFAKDPTGASAPADIPLAPGRCQPCNKPRYRDASTCDSPRTHRAAMSARTPEHPVSLRIVNGVLPTPYMCAWSEALRRRSMAD